MVFPARHEGSCFHDNRGVIGPATNVGHLAIGSDQNWLNHEILVQCAETTTETLTASEKLSLVVKKESVVFENWYLFREITLF